MKKVQFEELSEHDLKKFRKKVTHKWSRKAFCFRFLPLFFLLFLNISFLLKVLLMVSWYLISTIFFDHKVLWQFKPRIAVWFGVPGSGKTSMAALLSKYSRAEHYHVLSNVELKGAYRLDPADLGTYDMSFDGDGCHVIYDEGSIDFDNRNYSQFAKTSMPKYFALHRHMNNRVDVFSQGFDVDKRIRDRCSSDGLFYLTKLPINGYLCYRRIKKILYINKEDKQMVDGFEFKGLPRIIRSKSVWNDFDTTDMSLCPTATKNWTVWSPTSAEVPSRSSQ